MTTRPKSLPGRKDLQAQLRILWKAFEKFRKDNGFLLSSGITFNLLVGLIPLTLLLLGLAGSYLYDDNVVLEHIARYLDDVVPAFDPEIMKSIALVVRDHRIVGFLGIAGLLLTATSVFGSLRTALNIVFQVERSQGLLHGKATDLLMLLLAGLFHMASMGISSGITYLPRSSESSLSSLGALTTFFSRYLSPFFFTFWMFFFIYKIAPNRKIHFLTALQASCFASLFWELAKQLFGWYVLNLRGLSWVYGSLSTLVVFVLWVYYSSAILLLGGEIALLLEKEGIPRGR